MRIVMTGAAGFVGSHLVDRLLVEGNEVIGVDNLSSGTAKNLEHLQDHPRFSFIEHNVLQPLAEFGTLDWVLHLAAPTSRSRHLARPFETLRVNSEGTFHSLELARRKGARFFLSSTHAVYGDALVHPQPETYWGNVNPVGPRSVYDEGKRYAEALATCFGSQFGTSVRIARIFNAYGPRTAPNDGRVVSNFVVAALRNEPITVYGNGSQTRSFQYVDDLVAGICRLMEVDTSNPVNLGNPEEHRILELAELVKEIAGSESEIVFQPLPQDDPKQRRPDITLARELLGWEPKVTLREGLARTIEYFRDGLE